MAQVRWSLTAGDDLQEIEDFIARDSILHAITFVERIVESTETLLKTPQLDASFRSSIVQTSRSDLPKLPHCLPRPRRRSVHSSHCLWIMRSSRTRPSRTLRD
ncbi:type II toxin-antitoxin system RelE/ParE family toxin [Candidatus Nitrospira nitrificans]|uniref:type II toxin-antitoxin system RelE/ParE family toxin n=1 Tax=Candidatus Nitrospira nitrificans TaxID=1742973 RepID=UPI0015850AB6